MLSIVIPVFNEDESLDELHRQITSVANANGYELDIIFIDDGSTDDSWAVIERLSRDHAEVRGVRFRRNFGKAAALRAGFKEARGELVFTMDADLQDDPEEMPRFLEKMQTECDVVSGYKQRRLDPWHKVYPSRIFNWLVSYLTGVKLHDHNCGFKCYRREIFDEVRLYGELHRFVPVLAASRGWRVGEVIVNHRPRQFGYSKYGFRRFVKGFLDLLTVYFLTGFKQRPQHLLGTLGVIAFFMGLLGLGYLSMYWIIAQVFPSLQLTPLHERPAVIYSMGTLLLGAQLMSMGFLAELMTAYYGDADSTYSISDKTDGTMTSTSRTSNSAPSNSGESENPVKKSPPPVPVTSSANTHDAAEPKMKSFALSPSDESEERGEVDEDPEMTAAWERARESVPEFLELMNAEANSDADFYVKKTFIQGERTEKIWLSDVTVDGLEFVGRVGNDPQVVNDIKFGEESRVAFKDINDWMVQRGETQEGGFTVDILKAREEQS